MTIEPSRETATARRDLSGLPPYTPLKTSTDGGTSSGKHSRDSAVELSDSSSGRFVPQIRAATSLRRYTSNSCRLGHCEGLTSEYLLCRATCQSSWSCDLLVTVS